jgi:lipoate-protein ligase A
VNPVPIALLREVQSAANLAADEALFRDVSAGAPPAWRLWVNPPCVVLGKHQDPAFEANLEACASGGVPVLRRFTGGGAVYLDEGCLCWTVCEPSPRSQVPGLKSGRAGAEADPPPAARPGRRGAAAGRGLVDYARCGGWIPDLLEAFGLEGRVVSNRVEIGGKKICGMAARAGARAVLVHGTLLVSTDLERLRLCLAVPPGGEGPGGPRAPHVRSRPWPVTSLEAESGRHATVEEAAAEARRRLRERLGFGEWRPGPPEKGPTEEGQS